MTTYDFNGISPKFGQGCYVAPGAKVIGNVEFGDGASVWFNTVVRADVHYVRIGSRTNIQDNSTLHVTGGLFPLNIGECVTIGHRALVHGCTIGDRVLIGMGAIVMDGAEIGDDSIIAAGTLVPEGAKFGPRSVLMGIPAKVVREVTTKDMERIMDGVKSYTHLSAKYLSGALKHSSPQGPAS